MFSPMPKLGPELVLTGKILKTGNDIMKPRASWITIQQRKVYMCLIRWLHITLHREKLINGTTDCHGVPNLNSPCNFMGSVQQVLWQESHSSQSLP